MDKKHKTLLKRYRSLEGQLESMKGGLERVKDAPNAGTASKMLRRYRNTMIRIGEGLNRANPAYRAVEKRLRTVEDALDDYAGRKKK
jgi:CII-binding regulator of phage lambda lysogenization HflD